MLDASSVRAGIHGNNRRRDRGRGRRDAAGRLGVAERRPADWRHGHADHRHQRHLSIRRPAARHLHDQVRAAGLSHGRAAGHRRQRQLYGHGQPEARSRRAAGDHHRRGRVADGGRQVQPAADRDEPGDSRGRADRARSVVAGQDHPRRPGEHLRRRRHAGDAAEPRCASTARATTTRTSPSTARR